MPAKTISQLTQATTIASGDEFAIEQSGVTKRIAASVVRGDIANANISASAAIAHSKLANITAGQVLLGNASNVPTATALTGDVTVNSSGVTTIGTGAVTGAAGGGKLAASAITSQTVIADALADTDEFLVHDASASALRRVGWSSMRPITLATAQASTSGTSIDFTGIPSWAKRITVMFNGVSTNGSNPLLIQLGNGSFVSSGYASGSGNIFGTNQCQTASSSSGFIVSGAGATLLRYGHMTLTNITGNAWVSSHSLGEVSGAGFVGAGSLTLSGALDRVRITTVNGTDTFDAGTINISYE